MPPEKWRDKLNEIRACIDVQLTKADVTTETILKEFVVRMTGTLREWFQSLGPYRQLSTIQLDAGRMLGLIHKEFLGGFQLIEKQKQHEYFEMKCCSLKKQDLDRYFQRMAQRYYMLNGFNDPNLKHTFIALLLEEFQPELQRAILTLRRDITDISLGEIYQLALTTLDKIYEQQKLFHSMIDGKTKLQGICKKPYL